MIKVQISIVYFILFLFYFQYTYAQTPTKCFEIESILVDACGVPEETNEMVFLYIGTSDLNYQDMIVKWPFNPWQNICQNATTATKVQTLNNSIISCGFLLEPTNNILPAGSKVLLVCSTDMDTLANKFTNLRDTIYIIFQCPGNSSAHFKNASISDTNKRTLIINFSTPGNCSDTVAYIPVGWQRSANNGDRVNFEWDGIPKYVNLGCQAPYTQPKVNAGNDISVCNENDLILNASSSTNSSTLNWYGGNGTFNPSDSLITSYKPDVVKDTGSVNLFIKLITSCNDTVYDTLVVNFSPAPQLLLQPSDSAILCQGDSIVINASGAGNYQWSTGETLPTIKIKTSGVYKVTTSSICGVIEDSIIIRSMNKPITPLKITGDTIFCVGDSVRISAYNGDATFYQWSNLNTDSVVYIKTGGDYYSISGNVCGVDTSRQINIIVDNPPIAEIYTKGLLPPLSLCPGDSIKLGAKGGNSFIWQDNGTITPVFVKNPGNYSVTVTNTCGTDDTTIVIGLGNKPIAGIASGGKSKLCRGDSIILTAVGGDKYLWSNGDSTSIIKIKKSGIYSVMVSNKCGRDTTEIKIDSANSNFSISATPLSGTAPLDVIFSSQAPGAITFLWTFGDGTTSNLSNPTHTFQNKGEYKIFLLTTNSEGCTDTAMLTVQVNEKIEEIFNIPSVLTPNGDNVNDIFKLDKSNVLNFEGMIFSRWGKKVYSWNNPAEGWDGRSQSNVILETGIYFYILKFTDGGSKEHLEKGNITLIR